MIRGKTLGLKRCSTCGSTMAVTVMTCKCCCKKVYQRINKSQTRTWALLISAFLLYFPANMLPMMTLTSWGVETPGTIMSSVITLFKGGMVSIAILIFIASFVIPILKIAGLAILLCSAKFGSPLDFQHHIRLYRFVEKIGRWSMLDVFVIGVLLTLLNFSPFLAVSINKGTVAFGAVVVLTMLAAATFDPRIIWDTFDDKVNRLAEGAGNKDD